MVLEKNAKQICAHYTNLTDFGSFDIIKMWQVKKKLFPGKYDRPTAMRDPSNNLICDKKSILNLFKNEFMNRLSYKPPLPQYKDAQLLKENQFKMHMEICSLIKSQHWNIDDLSKVCRSLKNGKSRDESGLIYEVFKPGFAGHDLLKSLLILFNEVKDQLIIPEFMQLGSITSFQKVKCA